MDGYMGEMRWVAFRSTPPGWMPCEGQILKIDAHMALFSLLGNTYGGDGRATFALPNLPGRTLIGAGYARNLEPREFGRSIGEAGPDDLTGAMQPVLTLRCLICTAGMYPTKER
jgi:microcystin-dependent protein